MEETATPMAVVPKPQGPPTPKVEVLLKHLKAAYNEALKVPPNPMPDPSLA